MLPLVIKNVVLGSQENRLTTDRKVVICMNKPQTTQSGQNKIYGKANCSLFVKEECGSICARPNYFRIALSSDPVFNNNDIYDMP